MKKISILFYINLILFSANFLYASSIDLTERDMYVRQGFDKKWTISLPEESDKNWQKFPAKKDNRPVRVRELKFKDLPKFKHFSIKKHPVKTFTYVTTFELTKEKIESGHLGLFLAQIGLNWEVYLNGILQKSEMHIDENGSITIERAVRSEIIELNHHHLKIGVNFLAFRIVGNPVDDRTGFFMKANYKIDNVSELKQFNQYVIKLMLIGVYIFFGLYHIFLFIIRRQERFNFAYGIFAISVATFWLCRTEVIFSLFDDTYSIRTFELVALSLLPGAFIPLNELLVKKRTTLLTRIWTIFSIIVAFAIMFIWRESLLRVTQVSVVLGLIYSTIFSIVYPFIKKIIKDLGELKEERRINVFVGTPLAFARSLIFTIPGNMLIGIIVLFATSTYDIISVNIGKPVNYSMFGFAFFVLGIAGILANRFVRVHNRVEELNVSLEHKVMERTEELQSAMEELEAINNELVSTRDALWGEMELAKKIQTVLVPMNPRIKDYEIAVHMKPADEVGGDYYDILNVADHDWVVIGDVSGHGVPAGLIMMMVQTCIQIVLYQNPQMKPSSLLTIVNRAISNNIKKLGEDKYMTITVMACFKEGEFVYSGLHQDILIYRSSTKDIETIETEGMWLGLVDDVEQMMTDSTLKLEKDDVMLLYTDGITEAWEKGSDEETRCPKNDMFGEERLVSILTNTGDTTPENIKGSILKELENYICADDVTIVAIKRLK